MVPQRKDHATSARRFHIAEPVSSGVPARKPQTHWARGLPANWPDATATADSPVATRVAAAGAAAGPLPPAQSSKAFGTVYRWPEGAYPLVEAAARGLNG